MPVLDGPMTMPVLDGVKPMAITLRYQFAEQASFCFERDKKAYIAGLGRDQLEHLASPMTKSESKYQRVQDKSETIEKRLESGLEYYSPILKSLKTNDKYMLFITKTRRRIELCFQISDKI